MTREIISNMDMINAMAKAAAVDCQLLADRANETGDRSNLDYLEEICDNIISHIENIREIINESNDIKTDEEEELEAEE